MLQLLIDQGAVDLESLKSTIFNAYKYVPTHKTLLSAVNNANFLFVTENSTPTTPITPSDHSESEAKEKASKIKVGLKYNYHLVEMRHDGFKRYLLDVLTYGVHVFSDGYDVANWVDGFVLVRKYSRKDVFRILNWDENPVAQNVGGYMVSGDKADCAAFINYHKDESISATIQYEDAFVDRGHFDWMSKSKRSVTSPDVVAITGHVALGMRIPLFVKKHNDEGQDFYYMGDMAHLPGKVWSVVMADGKTSAVRMGFKLSHGVEAGLYRYITDMG